MESTYCNLKSMERPMFWMDYKVNIIFHMLHRSNLGWSVTYMSKEEPNGEFHGHLARFSLHLWHLWHQWWRFYNSYDTSHIWRMKSNISDISGLNRASNLYFMWFGEAQWVPTQFGRRWKVKREATWHSMSNHTNSTWIWFMDVFGSFWDHWFL